MIIYRVTNMVTGRVYIGATKESLRRRWQGHKQLARKGTVTALYNAIRKYGDNAFTLEHFACGLSVPDLFELEKIAIKQEGTKYPKGYNLTDGGEGAAGLPADIRERIRSKNIGRKHTADSIKRIGEASRGHPVSPEVRERLRVAHTGKTLSPEHRAKLSIAKLGKKLPERTTEHSARISEGLKKAWSRRRGTNA